MNEILEQKINQIINRLDLMHPNDPDRIDRLDEIVNLLLENEVETIHFLKYCKDEKTIFNIAALLDRLPAKFSSQELLNVLESLIERFPDKETLICNVEIAIDELKQELLWVSNNKS